MPNYTVPCYFSKSLDVGAGNYTLYSSSISFLTAQSVDESVGTRTANSPIIPQTSNNWAWSYVKGVVWLRSVANSAYTISKIGIWMDTIGVGTRVMVTTAAYGGSPNMDGNPLSASNSSTSIGGLTLSLLYPNYSSSTNTYIVDAQIASGGLTTASSDYLLMALRVDSSASPGNWNGTLYYTYTVQ